MELPAYAPEQFAFHQHAPQLVCIFSLPTLTRLPFVESSQVKVVRLSYHPFKVFEWLKGYILRKQWQTHQNAVLQDITRHLLLWTRQSRHTLPDKSEVKDGLPNRITFEQIKKSVNAHITSQIQPSVSFNLCIWEHEDIKLSVIQGSLINECA